MHDAHTKYKNTEYTKKAELVDRLEDDYLRLFTSLQTPFDIDNHNAIPKESLPKIDIIFKNNKTFASLLCAITP